MLACVERNGGGVGKCGRVWGPNIGQLSHISLIFPYISPYLPHTPTHFSTPPLIPLLTSPLPTPTPQNNFLLSPHLPSPSQSVVKLPCDEVSVAKLLWQSYHVAKLLATLKNKVNTTHIGFPDILIYSTVYWYRFLKYGNRLKCR